MAPRIPVEESLPEPVSNFKAAWSLPMHVIGQKNNLKILLNNQIAGERHTRDKPVAPRMNAHEESGHKKAVIIESSN